MDKLTIRQKQFSDSLADKTRTQLFNQIQACYNVHCVSVVLFHHLYNTTENKDEFQKAIKKLVGNFKNGMGWEFDKDLDKHQKLRMSGHKITDISSEDARGIYDILMKECLEPRMENLMRQYDAHDAIQKHKEQKKKEDEKK